MAHSGFEHGQEYGANIDGDAASIGASTQINPAYFFKKALIEIVKERYFGQLADVRAMPKNMGKTIKQHHYLPLLDDRNVNDQGIDANGIVTVQGSFHAFYIAQPNTLVLDATMAGNAAGYADVATGEAVVGFDVTLHKVTSGDGALYGSSEDVGTISSRMPALTEHGG